MFGCFSHVWLCNPVDCSPPGSFVRGILQARILESEAISSSSGSPWPGDETVCLHLLLCRWILYLLSHLGNPFLCITQVNSLSSYFVPAISFEWNTTSKSSYKSPHLIIQVNNADSVTIWRRSLVIPLNQPSSKPNLSSQTFHFIQFYFLHSTYSLKLSCSFFLHKPPQRVHMHTRPCTHTHIHTQPKNVPKMYLIKGMTLNLVYHGILSSPKQCQVLRRCSIGCIEWLNKWIKEWIKAENQTKHISYVYSEVLSMFRNAKKMRNIELYFDEY